MARIFGELFFVGFGAGHAQQIAGDQCDDQALIGAGTVLTADQVREFLLPKLINAEHASYRANKIAELQVRVAVKSPRSLRTLFLDAIYFLSFVFLQERTRTALLETLYHDLEEKNKSYLHHPPSPQSAKAEGSGLFDTFKRAISGKVRSQSVDSHLSSSRRPQLSLVSMASALPPVGEHSSKPNATPILRLVTMTQ